MRRPTLLHGTQRLSSASTGRLGGTVNQAGCGYPTEVCEFVDELASHLTYNRPHSCRLADQKWPTETAGDSAAFWEGVGTVWEATLHSRRGKSRTCRRFPEGRGLYRKSRTGWRCWQSNANPSPNFARRGFWRGEVTRLLEPGGAPLAEQLTQDGWDPPAMLQHF